MDQLKILVEQYDDDYLGDYDYPWAEEENERLRTMWTLFALQLMELLIGAKRFREAVMTGSKILRNQPYCEEAHFLLLQAYHGMGDFSSMMRHYRETEEMFRLELGIGLQAQIVVWYKEWHSSRSDKAYLSS